MAAFVLRDTPVKLPVKNVSSYTRKYLHDTLDGPALHHGRGRRVTRLYLRRDGRPLYRRRTAYFSDEIKRGKPAVNVGNGSPLPGLS